MKSKIGRILIGLLFVSSTALFAQKAKFNINIKSGCSPLKVGFVNLSESSFSYLWKIDDIDKSTSINFTHNFLNNTQDKKRFKVQLIAFNSDKSLSDTISDTITVYPSPISSFATSTENGCSPLVVDFTNSSLGGKTFNWNFGNSDQSLLKNPVETFTNNTSFEISFNVKLLVINEYACSDSTIKPVKLFPHVKSSFEADKLEGTTPLEIKFVNNSNATINNWNFGDGTISSLDNPSHIYYNKFKKDTSFRVSLKVMNDYGCADSLSKIVKVLPNFANVIDLDHENSFSIYPNPAHNILYLQGIRSIEFVDIIDYSGKLISSFTYHEAKNVTIEINSLKPGNYLLRYGNTNFVGLKKIEKK